MDFNKLLSEAQKEGINELEVYEVKTSNSSIETFNGIVDKNVVSNSHVFSIRGVYNNHIVSITTEVDSDDEINKIIGKIKENSAVIESDDPYIIYGGSKEYPVFEEVENDYDKYNQNEKIKYCLELEKKIKEASPLVEKVSAAFEIEESMLSIKNSSGLNLSRKENAAVVVAEAFLKKGEKVKTGWDVQYLKKVSDFDLTKAIKFSVERPIKQLDAKFIKSGIYNVIFENKVVSSLIGAFSQIFSAEAVRKNMSLLQDRIGEKIFGDNITIVDDPLDNRAKFKIPFDDEGVACKKKVLVQNGELKSYLHNLKTARIFETESTGNGFKAGGNIGISPTNMYIEGSETTSFDEMLQMVGNGVLITDIQGLHAGLNPVSGSFNLQSSGFKIKDGKISDAITLFVVSGNIIDMLNNVKAIGNDFDYKGSVGSGSLLVENINISGK